jgi:ubiquinone/menaquinone biosynthesis C-methylase UbiE
MHKLEILLTPPFSHENFTTIKKPVGKHFYKDVIEWDVPNWSRSLHFWSSYVAKHIHSQNPVGLEIGARDGGISLYFAAKHNFRMVCSDYGGPTIKARETHKAYGVADKIEYADVNAMQIPYPDNTFDMVVFKSVLGALGRQGQTKDGQTAAILELYRVLKPGGVLLFAENLKGSVFHNFARKKFVPWGPTWRYVTVSEMKEYIKPYRELEYETFGFFGASFRNNRLKRIIYPLECLLHFVLPKSAQYIIYGAAVK